MSDTPATATRENTTPCPQGVILKLLDICKALKFPVFFIEDFIAYQNNKNWIYNGKRINNPAGVFTNWARVRRQSMIANSTWRGANDENWEYTPAVFFGFKKAKSPKTEHYIETLIYKISHAEPMTQQESDHAAQMGIFKEIEILKENYKDENPDKTTTPRTIYRVECKKCGFKSLNYKPIENMYCARCGKTQYFEQIIKEDFEK